jgi:hypothetical protein
MLETLGVFGKHESHPRNAANRKARPFTHMRIPRAIAFFILSASQPALAQGPKGSVVAVDVYGPSERANADLRATAASRVFDALAAAQLTVTPVSDANLVTEILDCVGEPCLQDLAKSADLALVVQVRIQAKKTAKKGKLDYTISMVVARDAPDRNSWREKGICPECDVTEAKQQVFLIAGTIGDRIQSESQKAKQAPVVSGPVVPAVAAAPPPAVAPPVLVNPPQVEKEPPGWYVPRYLSIAALGGGAALIVTGIVLRKADGGGTCTLPANKKECSRTYSTGGLGMGLIWGGGAAVIGGLAGLLFFGPSSGDSHVAVGFSGSSLLVGGAF